MGGFATVKDTLGRDVIDQHSLARSQGATAQSWSALAVGSSLMNSSGTALHGSPTTQDQKAGYLKSGQPFGNPSNVLVPGDGGGNQVQLVTPGLAGQAGVGFDYPNTRGSANPAPDPMFVSAWTPPSIDAQMVVTTSSLPSVLHGTAYSQQLLGLCRSPACRS